VSGLAGIGRAATFTAASTTDAVDINPGDGVCATAGAVCTLRAAIQETNALGGTNTIILPSGTYTLSIAGTDENASASGDLDIVMGSDIDNLTITGAGAATTIIDGGGGWIGYLTKISAILELSMSWELPSHTVIRRTVLVPCEGAVDYS